MIRTIQIRYEIAFADFVADGLNAAEHREPVTIGSGLYS
jgi:hypothetical protein